MNHRSSLFLWRVCHLSAIILSMVPSFSFAQDFQITRKDPRTYVIEFNLSEFRLDPAPGQADRLIPRFEGGVPFLQPDSYVLSQTGFLLILPEDTKPAIRIVDYVRETRPNIKVLAGGADAMVDVIDEKAKITSPFTVSYSGCQIMAGVPLHAFQLVPFSYDPNSSLLEVFSRIVLEVKSDRVIPNLIKSDFDEKNFGLLKDMALNYSQIRITPRSRSLANLRKGESHWYDPEKTHLKLYVTSDGVYRIHRDEITNLGIATESIDPRNFALIYRGNQHPIYVSGEDDGQFDQSDFIEFYGVRNTGTNEYYNAYSDSSVYWLTWAGSSGSRVKLRSVSPGTSSTVETFRVTQHFEEDEFYHNGDTSLDIYNTDQVSGEGWIWKRLFAGQTVVFPFELDGVNAAGGDSISLKVRGITDDVVSPDHHIEIIINDESISELYFDGTVEARPRFGIPAGVLLEGANELRLISKGDTGAQLDAIYLDWFRVSFVRDYIAINGEVRFAPSETFVDSLVTYELNSFSSDSIVLYDVHNLNRLEDFLVNFNGNSYSVTFSDSFRAGRIYLAAEQNAIRSPARIVLDMSSDLHNMNNGADYIIIAHRLFLQEADELAEFRSQTDGLRTVVVDYEDVLDEFNFGMKDPLAARAFIKYAVENWQAPVPRFVLLFGDATWDYKKNAASSVKDDFVSAYGNPVSDNRLVSINGASDIIPDLFVGRLPVETISQAAAAVEKIKLYEEISASPWLKNIIFLNGGITSNEQSIFRAQSDTLIKRYVESPPFGGNPIRIYKESLDNTPGELRDEILAALDNGASWLSFSGHAGSSTWDLMLSNDDISLLQNEGKLPFITSMTCHTARFANPVLNSFGEVFIRQPMKGAIAFWGTSGWGYILQDGVMLDFLFNHLLQDGITRLGEATTQAKLYLWTVLGFSQINISTIDQYTLLGDPALELKIPDKPDPLFLETPISVSPAEPSQSDSLLSVAVSLYNQGLFVQDSLEVRLTLTSIEDPMNAVESNYFIDNIGYRRDMVVTFNTRGLAGNVVLSVDIDPENRIEELNDLNNHAEIDFYIFSSSISLLSPIDNGVIATTRPRLSVYSPEARNLSRLYHFELDTVPTFDSPFLMNSDPILETPILTQWPVNGDLEEGIYFWRSRFEEDRQFGQWVMGKFSIEETGTIFKWRQNLKTGFGDQLNEDLSNDGDAIRLAGDSLSGGYRYFGSIASEEIGPGISWNAIELQINHLDPATSHLLHIQAYDRFSKSWQTFQQSDQTTVPLTALDGDRYSMIRMILDLMTTDSLASPEFYGWQVAYQPASDLATHPDLIRIQPDSVLHGREAFLSVTLRNVGLASAFSLPVQLELRNENTEWDSLNRVELDSLAILDSAMVTFPLRIQDYTGNRTLRISLDPDDGTAELNEFNNLYMKSLFVARDTTAPEIHIEFDEREVLMGEFVSSNPVVTVRVNDNSPLAISDTSLVRIILDSKVQTYGSNPDILTFVPGSSEPNQGAETLVVFRPVLASGSHILEVLAQDASLNEAYGRAEFTVETALTLRDVMNVPNPFSRQTHFTYVLTQPADRVELSVYTVAGRKILDFRGLPANPGFNSVQWDGRDQDGDRIANGVYLYRLRASTAGEESTAIEKLIIVQ